jgi:lipopolysaccharide transport system ATP-binding protein
MRSDAVVLARNVAKNYRIFGNPTDRIKQALTLGKMRFHREFTALRDVSLEVGKGEAVGIIGRNGSGKSTLLQLICGIQRPTSGAIEVNGRIAALLELGAGFNPEFTGRENVYFQGAVQGFTKAEMNERFDDIAAFADIGEFIDQPVRTYSSGMFIRLAFSTAISANPDIFVIDEALSVGDFFFQQKCIKRIAQLRDGGTSLLIVSHDRSTILSTCNRAILLTDGEISTDGAPEEVMDYYQALAFDKDEGTVSQNRLSEGRTETVSGTGEATVESLSLLNAKREPANVLQVGEELTLNVVVRVNRDLPRLVLGFMIRDRFGLAQYGTNTHEMNKPLVDVKKGQRHRYMFTFRNYLGVGTYSISTALVSTSTQLEDNFESRDRSLLFDVMNPHQHFVGCTWLDAELNVEHL